jgi:membrane protein
LFASSLAFHALISIVPLTIVVLWIASLIVGDENVEQMADKLAQAAPEGIGVDDAVRKVAELGTEIGIPSLIAALLPASAYGAGVRRGFAHLAGERKSLKGLRGRVSVLLLLPVFVLGALIGSYFGTTIFEWEGFTRILGFAVALLTGFAGGAAAIALMYRVFQSRAVPWVAIWRATVWTAGAISLISFLFTLYLSVGANFEQHYATSGVAGIVLLGLWLYLSNAFLLGGYQLALDYEKRERP